MAGVARQGDNSTGHDSCPPVPIVGNVSGNVKINGRPCAYVGSVFAPHGCEDHVTHSGRVSSGSGTVFVNGKPIARQGDSVSCGGTISGCSGNVNAS